MNDVNFDESDLPGLYMLWPHKYPTQPSLFLPVEYTVRPYIDGDDANLRTLLESDGENMSQQEWQDYKDKVLPGGLFVILYNDSLVATAGAAHNPNPGRYYFPLVESLDIYSFTLRTEESA